jgi:hypothetical protein
MRDEPETIGELVGKNADDIADAERVLFRFISAAEDADGEHVPPWLRTAHAAVSACSQHYRARLQTEDQTDV